MAFKHKLDNQLLSYIQIFSNVTNARLKDAFQFNDTVYFIVEEGDIGKAIGIKGIFAKTIKNKINKPIKIIEFSKDPIKFIKNFLLPLKVDDIVMQDNTIVVIVLDKFIKAKVLGKRKQNLELMKHLVKRYFGKEYDVYVQ